MTPLIRTLFTDLHTRLEKMISQLDQRNMASPVAGKFKSEAVTDMIALQVQVKGILEDGILEHDFFAPNTFILYNSLNNKFVEIELYRYLPLIRYNQSAEGYFETLIRSIYQEIDTPHKIPFVSTNSNSETYFWVYAKFQMISLPHGEESHLLNLPDLYHEIGHLLFNESGSFIVGRHLTATQSYFTQETAKCRKFGQQAFKRTLSRGDEYWRDHWSEELACDLIATYLVGLAYGWSHMKHCTISGHFNELYSYSSIFKRHPPDEVRMRAILKMLQRMGLDGDVARIDQEWRKMGRITKNNQPDYYQNIFPDALVDSIVDDVLQWCRDSALRSYLQQIATTTFPVSFIINQAWDRILTSPEGFNQWQAEQIENISTRTFP